MEPHRVMWWCLLVIITGPSLAAEAVERMEREERFYNCCDRVGKGFSVASSSPSALLFYRPPSALFRYKLDSCRCLCPRRAPYISCFLKDGEQIKHCEHGERQEWSWKVLGIPHYFLLLILLLLLYLVARSRFLTCSRSSSEVILRESVFHPEEMEYCESVTHQRWMAVVESERKAPYRERVRCGGGKVAVWREESLWPALFETMKTGRQRIPVRSFVLLLGWLLLLPPLLLEAVGAFVALLASISLRNVSDSAAFRTRFCCSSVSSNNLALDILQWVCHWRDRLCVAVLSRSFQMLENCP